MAPVVTVNVNINITEGKEDPSGDPRVTSLTKTGGNVNDQSQWVGMKIKNLLGNAPIQIKDASLECGKFYDGDVSKEISPSEVDQIVIAPSQTGTVSSSGRQGAMKGTEGRISLYDGSTKIGTLYWDCPYWSSTNTFRKESVNPAYSVTVGDWNHGPGAIGNVYIEVERLGA